MRAVKRYISFYLEHMRLEEEVILPAAQRVLDDQDWAELDAAFATNCDSNTGKYPRDATYDRLFTCIVTRALRLLALVLRLKKSWTDFGQKLLIVCMTALDWQESLGFR